MEYPSDLYQNGRIKLSRTDIHNSDYMYARHKPGYDWDEDQELPDFSKIKIDPENPDKNQSFNWDKFSKPHWTRFNLGKKYLEEYAVIGFLTETIRNISKYVENLEPNLIDIEHEPIEINYSHCQLSCAERFRRKNNKKEKRKIRRAIRMAMKHNSKVFLKPYENYVG
jgi:hypothetical protein